MLKQRGGLIAKGAAIGVQFKTFFEDGLYDELALSSNLKAKKLADGIHELGYDFLYPVETNLIVPIFPVDVTARLHEMYGFYDWENIGGNVAVRLLTSWATPDEMIEGFLRDLR